MKTSGLAITVAAMAIGLSAPGGGVSQDKIPELQKPPANSTTLTGCVAQGTTTDTYLLTSVTRDVEGTAKGATRPVRLVLAGANADVSQYVGHKVSVTGWVVIAEPATTISASEASKPATQARPQETGKTLPTVFVVESLKMISASCWQAGD